jgi:tRNA (cmo5U34)-methyltransferase
MGGIVIRENIAQHMKELKQWLGGEGSRKLEEMGGFFENRLEGYEEHMAAWSKAYAQMARLIPPDAETLLDLGCGTGLELDEIFRLLPGIRAVGIDLSEAMLRRLGAKHPDKGMELICADYFMADLGTERFEAAVSFETLHHFRPEKKLDLFRKICAALKPGGRYIEADYLACCAEEEELLFSACEEKRKTENIPGDVYVHFDTPLTAEHEISLMEAAGFSRVEWVDCINGASIVVAVK